MPVQQAPSLKVGLPVRFVTDAGETIATERINFVVAVGRRGDADHPGEGRADQGRAIPRRPVRARCASCGRPSPALTMPVVAVVAHQRSVLRVSSPSPAKAARWSRSSVRSRSARWSATTTSCSSGLKAGDKLITGGIQKIGDGAPVQAAPPGAPADGRGAGGGRSGGGDCRRVATLHHAADPRDRLLAPDHARRARSRSRRCRSRGIRS